MSTPRDPDELPARLVERLDSLDRHLPPVRPWRPAAPLSEPREPGALEPVRARVSTRWSPPTVARSRVPSAVAAALLVVIAGAALALGPGGRGGGIGAAPTAASSSRADPASPAAPTGAARTTSEPSAPAASVPPGAALSSPPGVTPTPEAFARLKSIRTAGTVEAEAERDFAWSCPVRVPPAERVDPLVVAATLRAKPTVDTIKMRAGGVVFPGQDPETAAILAGANLVIVDGDGSLWIVTGSDQTRIQLLAPVELHGATLGWWLADVLVPADCAKPTPAGR